MKYDICDEFYFCDDQEIDENRVYLMICDRPNQSHAALKGQDSQRRYLKVIRRGYWEFTNCCKKHGVPNIKSTYDEIITDEQFSSNYAQMRMVTVYEGHFRGLAEVLATDGSKTVDSEKQFMKIGEPVWKMKVERAELAREVIRLIKLHQKYSHAPLTAEQLVFVIEKQNQNPQDQIVLKILPTGLEKQEFNLTN